MTSDLEIAYVKTPLGVCKICGSTDGISEISILDDEEVISESIPEPLKECVVQLQEYFEGKRKEFQLLFNLKGTTFQKNVWESLLNIPFGTTTTYLKQARLLGDEKAIRAVASANGKNPIGIILPCHRVVGSYGSLTGYASGIWRKKWLLEHEQGCEQQRLF
jgi:methylated-DNA-[protein]-cysteine S-methyltransferase